MHAEPQPSKAALAIITLTLLIPAWMGLIDGMVVNVGLDTIAGNLGVTVDEASWISSIYALAVLFAMPLTGWLSTNFGRKRTFLAALSCFTAASLLCAMSGSLIELTLARFLQGLGGGLMIPLAMAGLVAAYPRKDLPTAFSIYGASAMIGPAIGPALGGWMLANFQWPWIFLINVPLGIVSLFMVQRFVVESGDRSERSPFDWRSLLVMVCGLTCLQYILQEGPRREWFADPSIIFASLVAIVALAAFIDMQRLAKVPFVDLRPAKVPSYSVGLILTLVTGIGFTGTALVVPLYMQDALQYAPDRAGFIMVPAAIGTLIGTDLAGRFAKRIPPSFIATAALLISAGATFWFASLGNRVGFDQAFVPRLLQGIGNGLLYVPLNVLMLSHMPKKYLDASAGVSGLVRQIGMGFGFALLATMVVHTKIAATTLNASRVHQHGILTDPGLAAVARWFAERGFSSASSAAASKSVMQQVFAQMATAVAYSEIFIIVGALFLVAIPFIPLFRIVPKEQPEQI